MQAEEQESNLKAQEEEVNTKKRELEVLIEEEVKLNNDIKKSQREIEMLVRSLSDVDKLLEEVIFVLLLGVRSKPFSYFYRPLENVENMKNWRHIWSRLLKDLIKFWDLLMIVWFRMFQKCIWSPSDTHSLSQTSLCLTSPTDLQDPRLQHQVASLQCRMEAIISQMIHSVTSQFHLLRPTICSIMMMPLLHSTNLLA